MSFAEGIKKAFIIVKKSSDQKMGHFERKSLFILAARPLDILSYTTIIYFMLEYGLRSIQIK